MTSNKARLADKQHDIENAIDLYEASITQGSAEFLDYVNLICLYFNCLDFGYASVNHIREDIEVNCRTRAFELIDEAEEKFGQNDELTFWRNYISYLYWGGEVGEWNLRGDSLVPYVFLALEFPTEENIQKARQLCAELEEVEDSERKDLFLGVLEKYVQ